MHTPVKFTVSAALVAVMSIALIGPRPVRPGQGAPPAFEAEALFTVPGPNLERDYKIPQRLIDLTDASPAGSSIRVSMYSWSDHASIHRSVANALSVAASRGVHVNVVLDGQLAPSTNRAITALRDAAVKYPSRFSLHFCGTAATHGCIGRNLNHNKFTLFSTVRVDANGAPDPAGAGTKRQVVVLSSQNLTSTQLENFNNAVQISGDTELYDAMRQYHLDLLQGTRDPNYHATNGGPFEAPSGNTLYFFPRSSGDTVVDVLGGLQPEPGCTVEVATAKLWLDRRAVVDELRKIADEKKCSVRVVGGIPSDVEAELEKSSGISVRSLEDRDPTDVPPVHSKYLIIKGKYNGIPGRTLVFTGSHNLSEHSLRSTDEVSIRINHAGVVRAFRDDFSRIWSRASCMGQEPTIIASGSTNVLGSQGNDVIVGTEGADVIDGRGGNDLICGRGGDDRIIGGTGSDQIVAAGGNDRVDGDIVLGGPGNDTLTGEGLISNSLVGDDGDDTIYGRTGSDSLDGGLGNDSLYGDGFETEAVPQSVGGNDSITGSQGDDTMYGGPGNDTMTGQFGDDTFYGGSGNDSLQGEYDNDTIVAGPGSDTVSGSDGDDLCGYDSEDLASSCELTRQRTDPAEIGQVVCGGRQVTIAALSGWPVLGTPGPDIVLGTAGNDVIEGMGGDDIVCASYGADVVRGGSGHDWLDGGNDADRLLGGEGNDTLRGTLGTDQLTGEAGDDSLWGFDHDDVLSGGPGADRLEGGTGIDRLLGGDHDDRLNGNAGRDYVNGEAGSDRCVDHVSEGPDTLTSCETVQRG